jgi:hypothetical protein
MIDILESPGVRRRVAPISVESYHVLRDLGLVDVKTELVNGIIVEKTTKSPRHTLILHPGACTTRGARAGGIC